MHLRKLSVINFKNIESAELDFTSRINCLVGDNGTGKTNLIDAIYYLSMCRSALVMTDSQSVRHGEEFFMLEGQYAPDDANSQSVMCSFRKNGGKNVRRNGKEYDKLSDHIGFIPVTIVSPADTFLISDSADERRKYINGFLSQLDKEYLYALIKYNHVLVERNKLLKRGGGFGSDILEILDMQLVQYGELIHSKRAELAAQLAPIVAEYYAVLSGDRERVELSYKSELNNEPFADILRRSLEKDRVMEFTTSGVHRDDLIMKIGGYTLRKYGSQGQQKSFLVALKLAQYTIVSLHKNEKPILLLDDLFDKLDMQRVEKLIELVSGDAFGQIFISDCNKVRLEGILERSGETYSLFNVADGKITTL